MRGAPIVDAPQPIVEVENLVKIYRGWSVSGRRHIEALAGVTLQAEAGEVFGLLGPNGAGKTTLIKTLLGVIQPTRGRAALFGQPAGTAAARRKVGYLPESLRIDPHHTARSALRFYGRLSRMAESDIRQRTEELLDLVGLRGRDRESVRRFSKGMNQRLGLAQALLHDPDLLILDEPTDGLDPVGRSEVRRIIERLRGAGKTIFLNSHILQEVELVCTRVGIMAGGRLRGIGTIDELSRMEEREQVVMDVVGPADSAGSAGLIANVAIGTETLTKALENCFPTADGSLRIESLPQPEAFRIHAPVRGQNEVDAAVDLLRQRSYSITALRTRRPSLEETFLRLVDLSSVKPGSLADPSLTDESSPVEAPTEDGE